MKNKRFLISFLLIGAVSMLVMSLHYFSEEDAGILKDKALKDTLWYRMSFLTHIFFGLTAILIGPFQLINRLVQSQPKIHKKLGYVYFIAVAISSLTGFLIAQFAMGGMITRIGFSTLSCIWFISLLIALRKILNGDIKAHRTWMTINYALTFSSLTQRTILLFAFIPSLSFMPVYQLSSWLSWIFNLALVLYFINNKNTKYAF